MFLTSKYLWRVIQKSSIKTTKIGRNEAYKAFFCGFLTITFSPVIAGLFILDQLLYVLTVYIIPLLSILFMLFIGFPILKILQYTYFSIMFVWNMIGEYFAWWQTALTSAAKKLNINEDYLLMSDASEIAGDAPFRIF